MRLLVFGAVALRSSKLPGPCVRWDWLCHLSAAEAVTQYCGFPSRNDDGFRDFAWQKSASLHSHESRACHWAGRHCYPPTLPQRDNRVTFRRFHSSSVLSSPPPHPTIQPKINKHRRWLLESHTIITDPCAKHEHISLAWCVILNQQVGVISTHESL